MDVLKLHKNNNDNNDKDSNRSDRDDYNNSSNEIKNITILWYESTDNYHNTTTKYSNDSSWLEPWNV